jgi:hypothetical protein
MAGVRENLQGDINTVGGQGLATLVECSTHSTLLLNNSLSRGGKCYEDMLGQYREYKTY